MAKSLSVIGAVAFVVVVSGCSSASKSASRTETSPRERAAIIAALKGSASWQLARFPARYPDFVVSRPCGIPEGGPTPRSYRIRGTCTTQVRLHADHSATVVFTESWPKREFHGSSDGMSRFVSVIGSKGWRKLPSHPHADTLSYSYEFRISRGGQAALTRTYGDFPPQLVM